MTDSTAHPQQPLKILRVVQDYWPCVGGNERWNEQFDRWFSEVAGDDVQVVVFRPEQLYSRPGYCDVLRDYRFRGTFDVPHLKRVKAHQELLPPLTGWRLAAHYRKSLRPWMGQYDVMITQIGNFHMLASVGGQATALEPGALLLCTYEQVAECVRHRWGCSRCIRKNGPRWWINDLLQLAYLRRVDVIVTAQQGMILEEMTKAGLGSKCLFIRHIVEPEQMRVALTDAGSLGLRRAIDKLQDRYRYVLFFLNRLVDYHNPQLALDVVRRLPSSALVFAGDGLEKSRLERQVQSDSDLKKRVLFLGSIPASSIGWYANGLSGFLLTSTATNAGTSLYETMSLGVGPVFAVDTGNFPVEFDEHELIVKTPAEPCRAVALIRSTLDDRRRCEALVQASVEYTQRFHSPDQMWLYRDRLFEAAKNHR